MSPAERYASSSGQLSLVYQRAARSQSGIGCLPACCHWAADKGGNVERGDAGDTRRAGTQLQRPARIYIGGDVTGVRGEAEQIQVRIEPGLGVPPVPGP